MKPFPSQIDRIRKKISDQLPEEVVQVARKLGLELYAVGGCVRDTLLGRAVGDIDLAVVGDATHLASQVAQRISTSQVVTYTRFGTALVRTPERNLEFATCRRESYHPDSRKPAEVIPVSIEEDLQRRDFTINALALGLTGPRENELIDLFDGLRDIERKTLRTPLAAEVTFSDDPLRMLRAVRFAAEFEFKIDPPTWKGICDSAARLRIIARERVGEEFWKMLSGPDPVGAMRLLIDSGIMSVITPEVMAMSGVEQIGRHHHKDVLLHSLKVMQHVAEQTPDPVVRLAGLLHDIGKPRTKSFVPGQGWTFHGHDAVGARMVWRIGRRLRLGKEPLRKLVKLVRLHMRPVNLTDEGVSDSAIRRLMVEAGDHLDDQLILCRADITTANPKLVDRYLANFDEMARRMGNVEARDRMRRFQSPVRGDEIIELCGIEPGQVVGALKERIEDAILDGIIPYDYEAAKSYLMEIRDEVLHTDPAKLSEERRARARARRNITQNFRFPE